MATKKIKQVKSKKVYEVTTGATEDDSELLNWASYKVLAVDAMSAIDVAKVFFVGTEFAVSVELICELS